MPLAAGNRAAALGVTAALLILGQSEPRSIHKSVEAESFLLRDSSRGLRGDLSTRIDHEPRLWLYDGSGVRRIELSLLSDGTPGLRLSDRNEQVHAILSILDSELSLALRDRDGRERASLTLVADVEPSLFLWDKDGRAI
ncbi:MAG: hypothetical protein C4293_09670 [Nitrospiraceae bacterium]